MKKDVSGPISVIALKMAQPFDKIVIVANSWDEDWIDYENWLWGFRALRYGSPQKSTISEFWHNTISEQQHIEASR